jgi:hypothetical protein
MMNFPSSCGRLVSSSLVNTCSGMQQNIVSMHTNQSNLRNVQGAQVNCKTKHQALAMAMNS